MNKDLIHYFLKFHDKCDKFILHQIINHMDEETINYLLQHGNIRGSETGDYLRWRRNHLKPIDTFHVNEPVAQLMEWYSDKKSQKVVYARKQLIKRFEYLSYSEQCSIIDAFMQSGRVAEMLACCQYLTNNHYWKEEYLSAIEDYFNDCIAKRSHNALPVAKVIILHSSKQFISNALNELDNFNLDESPLRDVMILLLTVCDGDPHDNLKNNILRTHEYLYVMQKKELTVTWQEAAKAIDDLPPDADSSNYEYRTIVRALAQMGYYDFLLSPNSSK